MTATTEESLTKVKDYILQYDIESKLSKAVNEAIRLDSKDPFRVISDYLRQYAKVRIWQLPSWIMSANCCRLSLAAATNSHRPRGNHSQDEDEDGDDDDDVMDEAEERAMMSRRATAKGDAFKRREKVSAIGCRSSSRLAAGEYLVHVFTLSFL